MKNRIRELREENNLFQKDLAQSLNVSRQTIISIENGRYDPSLKLALQIAKHFNCTVEDIFQLELEDE
ncbi:helix-turn-helix transcriptional regulator [Virgibacillus soli]|uniref:Helix-turn-helix transcriptional regulator n=1 Tax=Paracerasibacillus soli TaxID=480284 RepID=A0ABU5CNK0_9BACI|nr:helix-turn-helix transcriptional regulator [Virgibacillus soli]MDY0407427.1 helix-turn-helix transcriptional regulator [Virgibacillus soli]